MVFWTGVLSYVKLAGAIHALVQALLLWFVRRGNRRANRIMAAFLLVLAIGMSHGLASLAGVYQIWPALALLMGTLPLLYGPLFSFYVRAIADPKACWQPVDALHVVPFLLGIAAYGVSWNSGGPAPDWRVIDSIVRDDALEQRPVLGQRPADGVANDLFDDGPVLCHVHLALDQRGGCDQHGHHTGPRVKRDTPPTWNFVRIRQRGRS